MEALALTIGFALLLRVLSGARIGKVITHLVRRLLGKGNRSEDVGDSSGLSVGLMSKYMYPLITVSNKVANNAQLKSAPYALHDGAVQVKDDYLWLEEEQTTERNRWLQEQNKCTERILKRNMQMSRGALQAFSGKLQAASRFCGIDAVYQRGRKCFITVGTPAGDSSSQRSSQVYCTEHLSGDTLERLASSSSSSRNGPHVVLSAGGSNGGGGLLLGSWVCSEGSMMAYAHVSSPISTSASASASTAGSGQWVTLRVRSTAEAQGGASARIDADASDVLTNNLHAANLSVAWLDGKIGFFYTQFSDSARHSVCFHRMGTSQSADVVVLRAPAPAPASDNTSDFYSLEMSVDNKWLLITVYEGETQDVLFSEATEAAGVNRPNRLYALDVRSCTRGGGSDLVGDLASLPLTRLIDGDARGYCWQYIANSDGKFWFRTNYGAEQFRVVSLSLSSQSSSERAWQNAQECIPEDVCMLETASVAAKSVLVLKYRRRQHHEVVLFDLNNISIAKAKSGGQLRPAAELPTSQCDGIEGPWSAFDSSSIFYRTTNFADPGCVWRARVSRDSEGSIFLSFEPLFSPAVPGFNMHDYETMEESFPFEKHAMLPPPDSAKDKEKARKFPLPNSLSAASTSTGVGAAGTATIQLFAPRIRDIHGSVAGSALKPNRPRRVSRVGGTTALGSSSAHHSSATGAGEHEQPRPCVLFVYGGFGMNFTPAFSSPLCLFSKHYGAIIAVLRVDISSEPEPAAACVLAAAEHLVARGLTSLRKVGLLAGTSGASICAIALNRRPDLFGAAVLQDGLYDLLRLNELNPPKQTGSSGIAAGQGNKNLEDEEESESKLESSRWEEEFGCTSRSPKECKDVLTLSPLHNVRAYWVRDDELSYPAVLLQASKHAAVNVSHSYKFTAQLQKIWGSNDRADNPILLGDSDNLNNANANGSSSGASARASIEKSTAIEAMSFLATYMHAEYHSHDVQR